jgi:hypothetical protein
VADPVIPALGRVKQEDHNFEASLGYIVSSRPAWTVRPPISKKKKEKKVNSL